MFTHEVIAHRLHSHTHSKFKRRPGSCQVCKQRKINCYGGKPCPSCYKLGATCSYSRTEGATVLPPEAEVVPVPSSECSDMTLRLMGQQHSDLCPLALEFDSPETFFSSDAAHATSNELHGPCYPAGELMDNGMYNMQKSHHWAGLDCEINQEQQSPGAHQYCLSSVGSI
ncbi:hypothetical protein WAI453_007431 [Rhynchosporium graminicola]